MVYQLKRIDFFLALRGKTKVELCEKAGFSRQYLHKLMFAEGRKNVNIGHVNKICEFLEIPSRSLLEKKISVNINGDDFTVNGD